MMSASTVSTGTPGSRARHRARWQEEKHPIVTTQATRENRPPPKPAVIPSHHAWAAWSPTEASSVLRHLDSPWCVVGGWAIDLWLGRHTRSHADLEIAVLREKLDAVLRLLSPLKPHAVTSGKLRALAPGEVPPDECHQVWMLDAPAGVWRVDVMLEPGDDDLWIYRRDSRLSMPRRDAQSVRSSIPYLNPELVLLFKAKAQRDKDLRDFSLCIDRFESEQKSRLLQWLQIFPPGPPADRAHRAIDGRGMKIRASQPEDAEAFRRVLDSVARERIHLALVEAPPLDSVRSFLASIGPSRSVQLLALDQDSVVGWCDIIVDRRLGFHHSGNLGMGLLPTYRGKGLGRELLRQTMSAAADNHVTRVALEVFEGNRRAIALYEQFGFAHEGIKKRARVIDGRSENIICMAWLRPGTE